MNDKCKSCMYWQRLDGHTRFCDYLGMTGKLRLLACPPGDQCTVWRRKG